MATDTAEYWQDVKRNYPYCGPNYFHIPNYDCGHRHLYIAEKLGDVNCNSCLKAIAEGVEHSLLEGKTISRSEKNRLAAIKHKEELYGRCTCGALRTIRTNTKTKKTFYGCTNYPKCTITTKHLNQ